MGADQQLPPIAAIEDVIEALRRLGVGVGVDESVPGVDLALAYSAVGAAERNAFATEQHARARGAGPAEFGEAVGAVLDGAACHSDLEVSRCWSGGSPAPPKRCSCSTSPARTVTWTRSRERFSSPPGRSADSSPPR